MENIERSTHWIWSLKGLIFIVVIYSLIHTAIRAIASDVIGQDDVIGNLFSQVLAAGYIPRQGPLYDWLLWCIQQITGPDLISFLVLKYTLVGIMLTFIYLAAKDIMGSRIWALVTALSVSLMYQIGWNVHEGVTHTATLMATIAGTFWAFVRLSKDAGLQNYCVFGLMLGLGFLSKHTFGVFPLILLLASMFQASLRRVIISPFFLVSLIVALLVTSPYLLWVLERTGELTAEAAQATGVNSIPYLQRLAVGLPKVITSPIGFLFPLIIVLPLVFPGFLKTWWQVMRNDHGKSEGINYLRLITHMMLISLALIALAVVSLGITRFEERYMHPFFLIAVIGLVGIAMKSCQDGRLMGRYLVVLSAFAILVAGIRITNLTIGDPLCGKCREFVPYNQLAEVLKEKGFQGGTIVTGYRHLAGNLRRLFPEDNVISVLGPAFNPELDQTGRPSKDIIAVWDPRMNKGPFPGRVKSALHKLGVREYPPVQTVKVPWKHLWRKEGYRYSTWKLIVIPGNQNRQKASLSNKNM